MGDITRFGVARSRATRIANDVTLVSRTAPRGSASLAKLRVERPTVHLLQKKAPHSTAAVVVINLFVVWSGFAGVLEAGLKTEKGEELIARTPQRDAR